MFNIEKPTRTLKIEITVNVIVGDAAEICLTCGLERKKAKDISSSILISSWKINTSNERISGM